MPCLSLSFAYIHSHYPSIPITTPQCISLAHSLTARRTDYLQVDALAAVPESLFEAPSGMPCHANDQPFGPTHTSGPVGRLWLQIQTRYMQNMHFIILMLFGIGLDHCRFYMSSNLDGLKHSFHYSYLLLFCVLICALIGILDGLLVVFHELCDLFLSALSLRLTRSLVIISLSTASIIHHSSGGALQRAHPGDDLHMLFPSAQVPLSTRSWVQSYSKSEFS
jgi:hypothetical protein